MKIKNIIFNTWLIVLVPFTLLLAKTGTNDPMNEVGIGHADHIKIMGNNNFNSTIKVSIQKITNIGREKQIFIEMTTNKDGKPVLLDELKEVHTQKIHLLVIDDVLQDYSHLHPKATSKPGIYEFDWNPTKNDGAYQAWVDIVPKNTNAQEYIIVKLPTTKKSKSTINRIVSNKCIVNGLTFQLSFDNSNLQAGKPTMGKIDIADANGNPVTNLEPVMGAYAHIVGFSDDLKSVVHIHPMGEEPFKSSDKGGPVLRFHLEPVKAGFVKLFAQVKVNGKELFAPFGIIVKG